MLQNKLFSYSECLLNFTLASYETSGFYSIHVNVTYIMSIHCLVLAPSYLVLSIIFINVNRYLL